MITMTTKPAPRSRATNTDRLTAGNLPKPDPTVEQIQIDTASALKKLEKVTPVEEIPELPELAPSHIAEIIATALHGMVDKTEAGWVSIKATPVDGAVSLAIEHWQSLNRPEDDAQIVTTITVGDFRAAN